MSFFNWLSCVYRQWRHTSIWRRLEHQHALIIEPDTGRGYLPRRLLSSFSEGEIESLEFGLTKDHSFLLLCRLKVKEDALELDQDLKLHIGYSRLFEPDGQVYLFLMQYHRQMAHPVSQIPLPVLLMS